MRDDPTFEWVLVVMLERLRHETDGEDTFRELISMGNGYQSSVKGTGMVEKKRRRRGVGSKQSTASWQ